MRPFHLAVVLAVAITILASMTMVAPLGWAQHGAPAGPYQILKKATVGGEGGFDYIFADVPARRLYMPRNGPMGQLMVFNLDTLEPAGSIPGIHSGGAVVDPKSGHGFSTTKPLTSTENAGSITFIKENSSTSFTIEQQTMAGAKIVALDTKTNHLFTMTAEYGPAAPDAPPGPAGRPARGPMVPGSFSILMVGKP